MISPWEWNIPNTNFDYELWVPVFLRSGRARERKRYEVSFSTFLGLGYKGSVSENSQSFRASIYFCLFLVWRSVFDALTLGCARNFLSPSVALRLYEVMQVHRAEVRVGWACMWKATRKPAARRQGLCFGWPITLQAGEAGDLPSAAKNSIRPEPSQW